MIITIEMIVADEVWASSFGGNSRMFKLKVESSRGIGSESFNISYQRGNIQSLCVHLCKICGWAVKPVVRVMWAWTWSWIVACGSLASYILERQNIFCHTGHHWFLSRDSLCCSVLQI